MLLVLRDVTSVTGQSFAIPSDCDTVLGDELRIVVEDWDLASGNDFMGEIRFPIVEPSSRDQTITRQWYTLRDKVEKDGSGGLEVEARGQLEVVLRWIFNPTLDPVGLPVSASAFAMGSVSLPASTMLFYGASASDIH